MTTPAYISLQWQQQILQWYLDYTFQQIRCLPMDEPSSINIRTLDKRIMDLMEQLTTVNKLMLLAEYHDTAPTFRQGGKDIALPADGTGVVLNVIEPDKSLHKMLAKKK